MGLILYSLDTLISIWAKQYFNVAFHVFAIYKIIKGYNALNVLNKLEMNIAEKIDE
ncbi:MAG: hypothetical protein ACERKV_04925 [Clostridiaceae bacterium]